MMKEKPKVQSVLESVFANAVGKLVRTDAGRLITGLCVQLDSASGEIQVYDDRETLLEKNIIFDWADRPDRPERGARPYKQPLVSIRTALASLKSRKIFDVPVFMKPVKISLVDDDFCEIETIFTLGEEEDPAEGRLMKNLEQDLQNFSKKLFADVE